VNPRVSNCPAPTNLVATGNVACDSIELNWNSNSGSSILVYGPTGFNPATAGTAVNNITAPYSVNGLTANTAYDFYVADICGSDTSNTTSITNSTANAPQPVASFTIDSAIVGGSYEIYLNGTGSTNATSYQWSFGNGSSSTAAVDTMIYSGNGNYTITLIVTNACGSDTSTFTTNVNIGLEGNVLSSSLSVYPNPAENSFNLSFREVGSADVQITLRDAQGRSVIHMIDRLQRGTYSNDIDVSSLARGIYMLEIQSGSLTAHRRISIK
jgi:PKD repeat protein